VRDIAVDVSWVSEEEWHGVNYHDLGYEYAAVPYPSPSFRNEQITELVTELLERDVVVDGGLSAFDDN